MGSSPIRVATRYASVAQLVEQGTENPRVVGSIPTGVTIYADLAHLVERHLAKVEVAGSSPVIRSKNKRQTARVCFLFLETPYGAAPNLAALSPAKTAPAVLGEITAQQSAGISVLTLLKLDVIARSLPESRSTSAAGSPTARKYSRYASLTGSLL